MFSYHLAIDIGASSGRLILSHLEDGHFVLEEAYRFPNGIWRKKEGALWDYDTLYSEIIKGLKLCHSLKKDPATIGIDTWGVDYVLLDENDEPIKPFFAYRDPRGIAASAIAHESLSFEEMYRLTGIQFQTFNTVYQLYDDSLRGRLRKAKDFLMVPEYLSFLLTGRKCHEYTNASTSGLLDAETKLWSKAIIKKLSLPDGLFLEEPKDPPFSLGSFKESIAEEVGFSSEILMVASHDTASAVAALPSEKPCTFLASGTWSLLGTEFKKPLISPMGMKKNFTNEGGLHEIRYLKNIMGLWLIQCLQREHPEMSFAEIAWEAERCQGFDYHLAIESRPYAFPKSISHVVQSECRRKGFPIPESVGGIAYALYNSLANEIAKGLKEIKALAGAAREELVIVGGGRKAAFLNDLIAEKTGKKIVLGSSEATALGNAALQSLYCHELRDETEMKKAIMAT